MPFQSQQARRHQGQERHVGPPGPEGCGEVSRRVGMDDLFKTEPAPPLAEALRPATIDEVIGQSHLLAPGKPLNLVFRSGKPHSMILCGPPGVGKTTLARLTAFAFDCEFIALSAVLSGVKDIRSAIEQAEQYL